jgi:hypothetical protein
MPQVSLYIDKETLFKIEQIAKKNRISISKWVGNNIKQIIKKDYPDGFFELFGAIQDASFNKTEAMPFNADTKRISI